MKRNIRKSFILLMTVFLFIVQTPSIFSQEKQETTIKVGYYEDGDYMSKNQQGEYVGYNIEYLQEISKQSGIHFEIVDTKSFTVAYEMLVKGEIDVLPAVYHNEDRAKDILFSSQPMCSIYTTLNVRSDDERYDYEDFSAFQGMKVGIIRDSQDGDNFKQFAQEHALSITIIDYDETNDLLKALDDETLDGVAITHLGKNSTFRSVSQFSPSPMYFTVTKGNPQLMAEINKAMNNVLLGNPSYASDLYDKYLAPSVNQTPVFTKEEKQYIKAADPIIVSYDPSFAPFSYKDKKSGKFKGVTADIFKRIEASSGLKFSYESHTQSDALKLLQEGKVDVLAVSDGDYLWDGRKGINSTLYYLRSATSIITLNDYDKIEKVALPKGYQLSETIQSEFSNYKIKYYETMEACLNAVLHHEADAVYANTQVAGSYLNKKNYKDMHTATLGQYISEMCIGVSISEDSRLFSIINKCIQYMAAEQIDASLVNHSGDSKEVSAIEFMEEYSGEIIGIVSLILGVIILLVSYNLRNALRSNRRIENLLYKDELTGQFNMNGFCRKWEENISLIHKQKFALVYADISQFKFINDNYGFMMGNEVLCAWGVQLQQILENDEFCGRLSSDHFAILMKYEYWEELLSRLDQIMVKVNEWRKIKTDLPYRIEMVFGVYIVEKEDTSEIHQMLDFANYARRYAKENVGKNVILYDEEMRKQALLSQELEGGLDRALQENEFTVYYQPQISMKDGQMIGSEALIRWNHPEKGFLPPNTFIPLFEKIGQIKRIDLWLFEEVCKTMNTWREQGITLLPISCNFSRLHFQEDTFPDHISEIANRWSIPHDLLEIEITESAILEGPIDFEKMFTLLKNHGFKIAIDDFGSGYSSLGQLQQLNADVLKLDRSFVSRGVTSDREQIVVGNVIHMANSLGMNVICEGVETLEQVGILQKIGCRIAQGFYYYRPMKKEDYENLLKVKS